MTELVEKHTSEYLKKVLIDILKKYDIEHRQVYSITCDNGKNIVKIARIFNEDFNDVNDHENDDNDNDLNIDDIEFDETEFIETNGEHDILSETEIQDMITEVEYDLSNGNLEQEVHTALEVEKLTECIRCSVHTFQLCVEHGLKIPSVSKLLSKARKVVKILQTHSYAALLKKENLKQGVIDVITQWSSTYLMVLRLYELRSFCKDHELINSDLFLNTQDWNKINCLIIALEPAYHTSEGQNVSLTASIDNFNDSQIIDDLVKDPCDEFEEFLKGCANTSSQNQTLLNSIISSNSTPSSQHIQTKLENFGKIDRLPYKDDVIEFWKNYKNENPQLFELAQILMAVPATQVSVERSFSSLKFILSDLRNSISSDLLEDILIIRGNKQ